MDFKGKVNERKGSEVDVKARLIIALIDQKNVYQKVLLLGKRYF